MSIIIALLVFSVLVIVHEWGHYIAAVKCGVLVEEFSIGMGPKLYQRKGKKTVFSIRLFPIGGYCKMVGEDETSDLTDAFCNKNVWQKILIVVAGALMNIVYAILLIVIIMNFTEISTTKIASVSENMPAYEAGIRSGDVIKGINGKYKTFMDDIRLDILLDTSKDKTVDLILDRNNKEEVVSVPYKTTILINDNLGGKSKIFKNKSDHVLEINGKEIGDISDINKELSSDVVKVRFMDDRREYQLDNDMDKKILQINFANKVNSIGIKAESRKITFLESFKYAMLQTRYYIALTYRSLGMMLSGKVSKDQVSGPVGIIKAMGDTYNEDIKTGISVAVLSLLSYSAILSINLGVVNLLPLPALDGGRFAILLIEVLRKKPMDIEKESWIHVVGFVLLMILMVLILFNDITKIIGF